MHVGILRDPVIFHAAQIIYRSGIVSAMNALYITPETEHEVYLPVCHGQYIKIGFGGRIPLAVKRIELPGLSQIPRFLSCRLPRQYLPPALRMNPPGQPAQKIK